MSTTEEDSRKNMTGVRGNDAYNRHASVAAESAAFIADLGISFLLLFAGIRLFRISPVPSWTWLPAVSVIFAVLWYGQRKILRRTLGELIWGLRALPADREGRTWQLFQVQAPGLKRLGTGIFLTALAWFAAVTIISGAYAAKPQWTRSELLKISPYMPSGGDSAWSVLPYYYTLGAWPATYDGRPVFESMPYEKGPPKVFLGRIYAKWRTPDIQVTFEGPKTPEGHGKDPKSASDLSRANLRRCLGPSWSSPLLDWNCMKIRETALARHVTEMENLGFLKWTLRWFVVENPALTGQEQAQGFFLRGETEDRFQTRFVVVTPQGTHQAFILDAPNNADGENAERIFEKSIGSLRVSDDLSPGRAWADRQLQSIDLNRIFKEPKSQALVQKLCSVQALLLAKLSVDPTRFDAYYHLAGTALLLLRMAAEQNQSDWSITAKPLIGSAYRYAKDVAPSDPRLPKLEALWLDSEKY